LCIIITLISVSYATTSNILSSSLEKIEKQDSKQLVAGVTGVFNQNIEDFSNRHLIGQLGMILTILLLMKSKIY
jgi:hypothetical protein